MEKKNRLRGPNFTKTDNMLLLDIINAHKTIIECKKTDGVTLLDKNKAWQDVLLTYNSSTTGSQRTLESLQQNYKNLKKKLKKATSDAKMNIPVMGLLENIEEFGTSSDGWEKVSESLGTPAEVCQEVLADLKKKADRIDSKYKKNIMATGGGPPPSNNEEDSIMEKVKVLVGPSIDGLYTIYDGDSDFLASQSQVTQPIEEINNKTIESQEATELFTNDRANLKKRPHPSLVQHNKNKKKSSSSEGLLKQSVSTKFISLASAKLELVALQKELLESQLIEQKEKIEHNHRLQAMEIEDARKKFEHNELLRTLELENVKLNLLKRGDSK